jgi:trimeric autotransporter adhesin
MYTIAGTGTAGYNGDGISAVTADFSGPGAVSFDAHGNVLVADTGNQRIRVVPQSTGAFYGQSMLAGYSYTVAGNGDFGYNGDGISALSAEVDNPGDVVVDAQGNLVIADTANNRIRVVALSTGTFYDQAMMAGDIYTVAGDGTASYNSDGIAAVSADLNGPGGVAVDSHGNLVIADTHNNRIRVVADSTGTFYGQAMVSGDIYTVAGNGTSGDGGGPVASSQLDDPNGVSIDAQGNLVVADTGNNSIRVVADSTGTFYGQPMMAGVTYALPTAPLNGPAGVALDAHGNVVIADTRHHSVQVFAPATGTFYGQTMTMGNTYTVAGDPKGVTGGYTPGDGVPAVSTSPPSGRLDFPRSVAVDAQGNLVIADTGNNRVRVVAENSGPFYVIALTAGDVYTVAGGAAAGLNEDQVSATTTAVLENPGGIALDANGNLVIADTGDNRVRVVPQTTGTFYGVPMTAGDIYTVAGNGTAGYTGDGIPAVSAELSNPKAVAVDAQGNVVIADGNQRIRVLAEKTDPFYGVPMTAGNIYTVAGTGVTGFNGDGIAAVSSELNNPGGVALDSNGNLVIADTGNHRIRLVAENSGTFYGMNMTAGDIYTVAGDGTGGYTADEVPAAASELDDPTGVTVDAHGNFVIADTGNHRIRVVDEIPGTFYGQLMTPRDIYTVAGDGINGYDGDSVAAVSGQLYKPGAVAVDAHGNLVIADTNDHRIRVVAESDGTFYGQLMTTGDIYTVVGNGIANYNSDQQPGLSAELNFPGDVVVDTQGDLYIADTGNSRVRELLRESAPTGPSAPTGLVATAGNNQTTLNWTPPASSGTAPITGYDILRSTTSGDESSTPIATGVQGTSYTDFGLTDGVTYFYEVVAVNAVRSSPPSNEASDTPRAQLPPTSMVPSAPSGLIATSGNAQVVLNWTASNSPGGAPISGYDILRGTTPGGESATPIATVGGTSFINTGLAGVTYFYEVQAVNAVGRSAPSNEASATPSVAGTGPPAPTGLVATASPGEVTLSWSAPTSPSNPPSLGYDVLRATAAGEEATIPIASEVAGTTYTDAGLTNGTTYYYEVEAINAVRPSVPSNEVSATPQPGPPGPQPTTVTNSLTGDGESGQSISVPQGTTVSDQATLMGANVSRAGGTVSYGVYTLSFFGSPFFSGVSSGFGSLGWQLVASEGTVTVANGSVPASASVTLGPGTYFWQATYSGDALNDPSQSTQGASAETVIGAPGCPAGFVFESTLCIGTPQLPPPPSPRTAASSGYDLVGKDGGVFVFPTGQAGGFYGSLPGLGISVHDVVGMVPSNDDRGYFLVGQDGGVFAFGDAPYLGSLPGLGFSVHDIRGIVPTSDDRGYFLVGQDGGVFAFGDAPYLGSLPGLGIHINNVIGIAATPSGEGYWLVTSNGTVYAFGNATLFGSATRTSSPVSGIASTPDGGGFWIVTKNGGVFSFGDAAFHGSLPGYGVTPSRPVIGLVPTAGGLGYWLIGGDGGVFAFGDSPFVGSLPGLGININDIVGAVPTIF